MAFSACFFSLLAIPVASWMLPASAPIMTGLGRAPVVTALGRASAPLAVPSLTLSARVSSHVQMLDVGNAWDAYNAALDSQPLLTKSLTACLLLSGADCAAQVIEREADAGIDFARVLRFAIFGLVLQAPWNHFYYLLLDGAIPPTPDPVSATNLAKVGIDQFLQAPVFTAIIFVFLGALEGQDRLAIERKLSADWWPTMKANWRLWIPATAVNIGLVPPPLRVLYINIVFFFWAIYLSSTANRAAPEEGSKE